MSPPPLRPIVQQPGVARIDAELRSVVRQEAAERLVLGRLAKVFSVRRAHRDIGFARIGDYTRERLGISTSQFYELAQVITSLTSLPLIEKALAAGEISWTKARKLVAVAASHTQGQWLEIASACTADELHAFIASRQAEAATAGSRSHGEEDFTAGNPDDDEIDDEEGVRVVIRCPQAVRLLWWQVLRLSAQVAGSELAAWQSVEFIAAEGLSESGWPLEPFNMPWTGWRHRDRHVPAHPPAMQLPEPCHPRARAERDHLARMAARAEIATAEQLDRNMRAAIARMQRLDADIGMLLCRMADGRLYRRLGYDDFRAYCRNALGICVRRARGLVAIERVRRRSCSRLGWAYRSGALSSHRCLLLLPVLTERTADAWIERAQQVTARRLSDEVLWSRMTCDAGLLTEPMPPQLGARLETDFRSFVQIRGSSTAGDVAVPPALAFSSALLDTEIRFRAPISVADMLRSAIFARHEPHEPVWIGLLRLLEHVRSFWSAAPKHRDPVFEREGWRCAVPGCSSRRNLHDHHVVFRSHGGGNERDNRVAVCASHHQHGIHMGVVRATGKASVGLDWELGRSGADGPLLRVSGRGEAYMHVPNHSHAMDWVRLVPVQASTPRVGACVTP